MDGREGVIAVWSPDYDGNGKAWCASTTAPEDHGRLAHRAHLTVGLLFPGEMGAEVGRAVTPRSSGRVTAAARTRPPAQRASRTSARSRSLSEPARRSSRSAHRRSPRTAEQVFALAFDGTRRANAISPERMRRIAGLGPRIVDGSIIAAKGINLYLAGTGAEEVAELFAGSEVTAIPIGRRSVPRRLSRWPSEAGTRSASR